MEAIINLSYVDFNICPFDLAMVFLMENIGKYQIYPSSPNVVIMLKSTFIRLIWIPILYRYLSFLGAKASIPFHCDSVNDPYFNEK